MSQSRRHSALETIASTAVGFGVSWLATIIVLPWFGFEVHVGPAFGITCIYTVLSLLRGYVLRRIFNGWAA
jgi:hypothetical protein